MRYGIAAKGGGRTCKIEPSRQTGPVHCPFRRLFRADDLHLPCRHHHVYTPGSFSPFRKKVRHREIYKRHHQRCGHRPEPQPAYVLMLRLPFHEDTDKKVEQYGGYRHLRNIYQQMFHVANYFSTSIIHRPCRRTGPRPSPAGCAARQQKASRSAPAPTPH